MNLVVEEEPMAYDDSLRELNGMFAAGVCNDVCPVNVLKCCSRKEMQKNQAMCFSADDTRYNARVVSVMARYLYITIGVGKAKTTLYSREYIEAWAEAFSLAGGIVKADMKEFENMVLEDKGYVWSHKDAKMWALIHAKEGLTPDTLIPVYVRHYLARAGDNFAILKKSYGHKSWEISSTSSGLFSMSSANRCYSTDNDVIKDCTGVWSKNAETGILEMASIKIGASRTRFDVKGIESMIVKTDVVVCDKVEEMSISDDDKTSAEDINELPAADCSLFPLVGNTDTMGTFFTTLTTSVRPRNQTRSCVSKGMGTTRGGGGRKTYTPEPEPEQELSEVETDISFATVGVGEAMYAVTGMDVFDYSKEHLTVPTMAIMCLLATDEDDTEHEKALTTEQKKKKAVQLVEAVAQQVRDIDKMFSECALAVISGIQQSTHAVAKDKMSAEKLSALEATKTVNKNTAFFGF
jgi:hypothetical protein